MGGWEVPKIRRTWPCWVGGLVGRIRSCGWRSAAGPGSGPGDAACECSTRKPFRPGLRSIEVTEGQSGDQALEAKDVGEPGLHVVDGWLWYCLCVCVRDIVHGIGHASACALELAGACWEAHNTSSDYFMGPISWFTAKMLAYPSFPSWLTADAWWCMPFSCLSRPTAWHVTLRAFAQRLSCVWSQKEPQGIKDNLHDLRSGLQEWHNHTKILPNTPKDARHPTAAFLSDWSPLSNTKHQTMKHMKLSKNIKQFQGFALFVSLVPLFFCPCLPVAPAPVQLWALYPSVAAARRWCAASWSPATAASASRRCGGCAGGRPSWRNAHCCCWSPIWIVAGGVSHNFWMFWICFGLFLDCFCGLFLDCFDLFWMIWLFVGVSVIEDNIDW